jgi:hypothetical protein
MQVEICHQAPPGCGLGADQFPFFFEDYFVHCHSHIYFLIPRLCRAVPLISSVDGDIGFAGFLFDQPVVLTLSFRGTFAFWLADRGIQWSAPCKGDALESVVWKIVCVCLQALHPNPPAGWAITN